MNSLYFGDCLNVLSDLAENRQISQPLFDSLARTT